MPAFLIAVVVFVLALLFHLATERYFNRKAEERDRELLRQYNENPNDPRWVKDDPMTDDSLPF